jgi:hypothetical protein
MCQTLTFPSFPLTASVVWYLQLAATSWPNERISTDGQSRFAKDPGRLQATLKAAAATMPTGICTIVTCLSRLL